MKKMLHSITASISGLWPHFAILIGFILLDVLWMSSLTRWGISYGSEKLLAFLYTFLRAGFFVFWLVLLLVLRRFMQQPMTLLTWLLVIPNLLLLVFSIYGFMIEPMRLTESRMEISVPGLALPMRIVQLSDIHLERTTQREQTLPAFVAARQPDLIVISGDLTSESYSNNAQMAQGLRDLLAALEAPLGIYLVNGNAEPNYVLTRILEAEYPYLLQGNASLQGLEDVHLLQNEVVRIPALGPNFALVGLSFMNHSVDERTLRLLMAQTGKSDFSLLLYHKPDLAYEASELGVDLYLAGHTHGGQVRLPFYGAVVTNSRHGKTFEMGEYRVDDMVLFVSRGLGFTGGVAPRLRFLAPPEIVVIDLLPGE